MFKFVLIFCAFYIFVEAGSHLDEIATRSTKVEGHLMCGNQPYAGAHLRLSRSSSEGNLNCEISLICNFKDLNDVIASGKTDSSGRFSIEGDTSRFQGEGH